MIQRIGFVHTVGFLVESFRERMREAFPALDCFHVLNESLLQDLLRGDAQAEVYRRVVAQILSAADAGADLIVVSCSSTSPAVDLARALTPIPILKIDDPMAALAVRSGPRIGLVCTATSTVAPSSALLQAHAAQAGVDLDITVLAQPAAYEALLAGDRPTHDRLILASVARMADQVDAVVLAQASLAHLQQPLSALLPVPVFASPSLLMDEIGRRLEAGAMAAERTHG